MSVRLRFTKMHGARNDYVYVLGLDGRLLPDGGKTAPAVSDRRTGVGSDGLVYALPSARADAAMRMWNADGSEAEMCGNAIRCVAKLLVDRGLVAKERLAIETLAGVRSVEVLRDASGRVAGARVDMGPPSFLRADVGLEGSGDALDVEVELAPGERVRGTGVSMGNPHFVLFPGDLSDGTFLSLGPRLERHPAFARRTNVELVRVERRDLLRCRVWERGSGETLACGTGACAALAAARRKGLADARARVVVPGGELVVEWQGEGGPAFLEGPAATCFEGEVEVASNP